MKARALLGAAALVVLSACQVKVDVGMNVHRDGSGTMVLSMAVDDDVLRLARQSGTDLFETMPRELPPGWKTARFTGGGFTGMRATHAFSNPAELGQLVSELNRRGNGHPLFSRFSLTHTGHEFAFTAVPSLDVAGFTPPTLTAPSFTPPAFRGPVFGGAPFVAPLLPVPTAGGAGFGPAGLPQPVETALADAFHFTVTLALPGKVTSHNATRVDGHRLVWELKPGATHELRAHAKVPSAVPSGLLALGVLALAGIGVAVAVVGRSSLGV